MGETCGKTGWRIHAYVLMGNHYDLLVETLAANLGCDMKWLQRTYTQRYNGRHQLRGHYRNAERGPRKITAADLRKWK